MARRIPVYIAFQVLLFALKKCNYTGSLAITVRTMGSYRRRHERPDQSSAIGGYQSADTRVYVGWFFVRRHKYCVQHSLNACGWHVRMGDGVREVSEGNLM